MPPKKTQVCRHFLQGNCRNTAARCPFLHKGVKQHVPDLGPGKKKNQQICQQFAQTGACPNFQACKLKHEFVPPQQQICLQFAQTGTCPNFLVCKLKHVAAPPADLGVGAGAQGADEAANVPPLDYLAHSELGLAVHTKKRPLRISVEYERDNTGKQIYGVNMADRTKAGIAQLFHHIDVDKNGVLTHADFDKIAHGSGKWVALQEFMDMDKDGRISLDEFTNAFKKRALAQPGTIPAIPPSYSLKQWLVGLETLCNEEMEKFYNELTAYLQHV